VSPAEGTPDDGLVTTPDGAPLLRVVSGDPDGDELAAVVAVVAAALTVPAAEGPPPPVDRWGDPAHRLGARVPGPDAWRTSAWAAR
jgi:hypothetical protein